MASKKTPTPPPDFQGVLNKVTPLILGYGMIITYTKEIDPFFKGDIDGKNIYIADHLSAEQKLFNILHLFGHNLQWTISEELRTLGSQLYNDPDDALLRKLQTYEYDANCYGLQLLYDVKEHKLEYWLEKKYEQDMLYLTHWYKTGEKTMKITELAKRYRFNKDLIAKPIPTGLVPYADPEKRNIRGIVVDFTS